jgi:hypothetical protein
MKSYRGVEVQLHSILTSALDGDCVISFTPRWLYPRERGPGTLWTGGWGWGVSEPVWTMREIPSLLPLLVTVPPFLVFQPVAKPPCRKSYPFCIYKTQGKMNVEKTTKRGHLTTQLRLEVRPTASTLNGSPKSRGPLPRYQTSLIMETEQVSVLWRWTGRSPKLYTAVPNWVITTIWLS